MLPARAGGEAGDAAGAARAAADVAGAGQQYQLTPTAADRLRFPRAQVEKLVTLPGLRELAADEAAADHQDHLGPAAADWLCFPRMQAEKLVTLPGAARAAAHVAAADQQHQLIPPAADWLCFPRVQVEKLVTLPGLRELLQTSPALASATSSFLPQLTLRVFLALLPTLLALLGRAEGRVAESQVEFGCVRRYFIFQVRPGNAWIHWMLVTHMSTGWLTYVRNVTRETPAVLHRQKWPACRW